jgi:hypothetical protein
MCMTGPCYILGACTVFHREDTLRDHLTRVWANNVHTQNLVCLLFCKNLDKTLGIEIGLGARISREIEFADGELNTGSLEFLFGLTDPSNLRMCVYDRGNCIVIHVPVSRLDEFDSSNTLGSGSQKTNEQKQKVQRTLLLSLVRQHRPEGDIPDALDILDGCVKLVVYDDPALVIHLHTDGLQVQTFYIWAATDSNKNDVRVKDFLLATRCGLHLEGDFTIVGLF